MKIARPSVVEERWLGLATRYPLLRATAEKTGLGGGWKTSTWLGRCLGFVLGLVGTGMLAGVLAAFPSPLLIGGLILMIVAEWLVAQRRVFRSGVEEAVYLCGAVAVVVQLLVWSSGNNDALGAALVSLAVLLVGWRLLNPLFTTLAAAGFSLAIALVGARLLSGGMNNLSAAVYCVALAIVALLANARTWQRPAHDRMVDGLMIVMPWLAHGWLMAEAWRGNVGLLCAALAIALIFLAANLFVGVTRRHHAPLVGALGNIACAAFALHRLLHWPIYWQLILAGALLLAAAMLLERRLHDRREGLTAQPLQEPPGLDLVQIAGAASMVPAAGAASPPGVQGHGGGFGGGGASGKF